VLKRNLKCGLQQLNKNIAHSAWRKSIKWQLESLKKLIIKSKCLLFNVLNEFSTTSVVRLFFFSVFTFFSKSNLVAVGICQKVVITITENTPKVLSLQVDEDTANFTIKQGYHLPASPVKCEKTIQIKLFIG
jgi:hypothetical protein